VAVDESCVQVGVLRVLEQFGANLTLRNRSGSTPLHTAAKYGATDAMTMLVRSARSASDGRERRACVLSPALESSTGFLCIRRSARVHSAAFRSVPPCQPLTLLTRT
jgi:ankyrin repeat protein